MQLSISIVDAFTTQRFRGNQAAVVPLQHWLPDTTLQAIAAENNLSETAYVVWNAQHNAFDIRWFSPLTEIDFCGHATLATAYVLLQGEANQQSVHFWAPAVGHVQAERQADGRIAMTFPRRDATLLPTPPSALVAGLSPAPVAYWVNPQAYMAVYASETQVRMVKPDLAALKTLGPRDVVVTAIADSGQPYDF
ncbi:MAG: PhzF family phenazine biosynthesis protein, partial [Comamonas sp.]